MKKKATFQFLSKLSFTIFCMVSLCFGNCWAEGYNWTATWGGAVTNRVEQPTAIETDSDNNIYFIEDWYHKLVKIDANGNLIWEKYFRDTDDNVYTILDLSVSDNGNTIYLTASLYGPQKVLKYSPDSDEVSVLDIQGTYISTDSNDNIYVTDGTTIKKYSQQGTLLTSWGAGGVASALYNIEIDSSDNIYVIDSASFDVKKFDTVGNLLTQIGGYGYTAGKFYWLFDLATDSQKNLYVLNRIAPPTLEFEIQKFSSDGTLITTFTLPDYLVPLNIALDSSGNVFITSADFYGYVAKYDANMNLLSTFTGEMEDGKFAYPEDITFIPPHGTGLLGVPSNHDDHNASTFFIADTDNHRIQKGNINGNTLDFLSKWGTFGTGDGQFIYPSDIACDYDYIYVVDRGNHRIQKFDQNGNFITKWGSKGSGNGQFNSPDGIVISEGNIYIADKGNYRIQKFDKLGNFITTWDAKDTNGQFFWPTCITADSSGNVYVSGGTGETEVQVQKFDKDGKFISVLGAALKLFEVTDIVFDKDDNIYITAYLTPPYTVSKVFKLDRDGKIITTIEGTDGNGEKLAARSVTIDPYLNIYITNVCNIWSFSPSLYYIKGKIIDINGSGLENVIVSLSNIKRKITITDAAGNYQFSELAIGNYDITPSKKGYYFDKKSISITPLNVNLEGQNFSEVVYPAYAVDSTITISGKVTNSDGKGIEDALVSMYNSDISKKTDTNGNYVITLPIMHDPSPFSTITVSKENYSFSPGSLSLKNLKENMDSAINIENQNFIGIAATTGINECKIVGGEQGYVNIAKNEKVQIVVNSENGGLLKIKVYDLLGALIWETTKDIIANNTEIISWDGKNNDGELVSSGIYIAHIDGAGINQIKKIAVVK